jgi:hypothetical protein
MVPTGETVVAVESCDPSLDLVSELAEKQFSPRTDGAGDLDGERRMPLRPPPFVDRMDKLLPSTGLVADATAVLKS